MGGVVIGGLTEDLWQVKAMVQGRDRRPELGYKLALEVNTRQYRIELNRKL